MPAGLADGLGLAPKTWFPTLHEWRRSFGRMERYADVHAKTIRFMARLGRDDPTHVRFPTVGIDTLGSR